MLQELAEDDHPQITESDLTIQDEWLCDEVKFLAALETAGHATVAVNMDITLEPDAVRRLFGVKPGSINGKETVYSRLSGIALGEEAYSVHMEPCESARFKEAIDAANWDQAAQQLKFRAMICTNIRIQRRCPLKRRLKRFAEATKETQRKHQLWRQHIAKELTKRINEEIRRNA